MRYTQFLIFEACPTCNLAEVHTKCPSSDPQRWARVDTTERLSQSTIIETAVTMYREHGFRGQVGFHYYNEPTLVYPLLLTIMGRIKAEVPWAEFVLWTNGTKLTPELPGLDRWATIWVSNYDGRDWGWLKKAANRVIILGGDLDERRRKLQRPANGRCMRMYNEIIFDHYGNCRACCMDWRGEICLGNLHTAPLEKIIKDFRIVRRAVSRQPMSPDAPRACFRCIGRQKEVGNLVEHVAADTRRHLGA